MPFPSPTVAAKRGQGRREVPGGEHFPDKGIKNPTLRFARAQEHAGVEQSST